jgi:hypothetical protein
LYNFKEFPEKATNGTRSQEISAVLLISYSLLQTLDKVKNGKEAYVLCD